MKKFEMTKNKPKTWVAWLAMVLGLLVALEMPALAAFSYLSNRMAATEFGPSIGITGILLTAAALIAGMVAYRKGERSWVLWVGLIPALLLGAFWALMLVVEIISMLFNLGV